MNGSRMFQKLASLARPSAARVGLVATTRPSLSVRVRWFSSIPASAAYDQSVESFPSLVIGADRSIQAKGSFATAQAEFLDPDPDAVKNLGDSLLRSNMGVVAHYYMDVELQGVLQAVKNSRPELQNRVGVADSLKMGDIAVDMCQTDGVTAVACLGVDFMAESVAAILEKNDFGHIPVYRATSDPIGCSLAESAERDAYRAWLQTAKGPSLHVVYINTSLETKAVSSSLVPTITCTSSNVLKTILQASAQMPGVNIMYGPDTYMGDNLVTLLNVVLASNNTEDPWDDARIARDLHPQHTRESLARLRDHIQVFPHGNCVVHHMFGSEVVATVKQEYDDCFMTAHLEVPGEMFEIAMEKSLQGNGVVGSTSDILSFISRKVQEHAETGGEGRLRFILGTEAGMVTSIVKSVQDILQETGNDQVEAEIIFPVAAEAVTNVDDSEDLKLVPGVAGGEGCSTAGGCATCPFMKMNDLDTLQDMIEMVERSRDGSDQDKLRLESHLPPQRLKGKRIGGVKATDLGTQPILYMRDFMKNQMLPDELVQKVQSF